MPSSNRGRTTHSSHVVSTRLYMMPTEVAPPPQALRPKEESESISSPLIVPDEFCTGKWTNNSETDDATPFAIIEPAPETFSSLKREKTLAAFCKPRKNGVGGRRDENDRRNTPVVGPERFGVASRQRNAQLTKSKTQQTLHRQKPPTAAISIQAKTDSARGYEFRVAQTPNRTATKASPATGISRLGLDTSDSRLRSEEKLTPANRGAARKPPFRYNSGARKDSLQTHLPSSSQNARLGSKRPSLKKTEDERLGGAWARRKEVEDEKTLLESLDVEKEEIRVEGKVNAGSHFDKQLVARPDEECAGEGMAALRLRIGKVLQQYETTVGG